MRTIRQQSGVFRPQFPIPQVDHSCEGRNLFDICRRWCHANCLSPPPPCLCRCRLAVAAFRRPNSPFVRRNYSSIIARLSSISDNWRSYTGGVHAAKGCFSAKNPNLSPIICRAGTGIARSGTKICRGRTGSCNHRTGIGLRITMICRPIICQNS